MIRALLSTVLRLSHDNVPITAFKDILMEANIPSKPLIAGQQANS